MIFLDDQIRIYFLEPSGIDESKTYLYKVYLLDKNWNKQETLFIGNIFLEANQSEVTIDITSIVRSCKKSTNPYKGGNAQGESTVFLRFDCEIFNSNNVAQTSEDAIEVNMMYRYPFLKDEMNSMLNYSYDARGSMWVSLQGRYAESGIGKFKLTPHYPFKKTYNYSMVLEGFITPDKINSNYNIKFNGVTQTNKFNVSNINYYWKQILATFLSSQAEPTKDILVDIAGDEVAIIDKCPARYYLQWKDRAGSWQSQRFTGVETFSETFNKEFVTVSKGKKPITIGVSPKIKIQTGFIEDELYPYYESIFVSPYLVLYDSKEDKCYQVNVTGEYTEKTFKNQGRQFFNLQLDLEFANQQNIMY